MDAKLRLTIFMLFIVLTAIQEILFLRHRICQKKLKQITIWGPQDKIGSIFLIIFYIAIWLGAAYRFFANELIIFFYVVGFIFVVAGIGIRIKALYDLGCNYAHAIEIYKDHKLIMRGIYGLVRHPLSLGLAIELLGMVLIAQTAWVWIIWFGLIVVLAQRTKLEDKVLIQIFRSDAKKYQTIVPTVNMLKWFFKK